MTSGFGGRATILSMICGLVGAQASAAPGRLEGDLRDTEGKGVASVMVSLERRDRLGTDDHPPTLTDHDGRFVVASIPAGTWDLIFERRGRRSTVTTEIREGETTVVAHSVDWPYSFSERLTVRAASRRLERIQDAPVAVSVLTPAEIERKAGHGQLARLFESAPGVEATQGSLFDFKINVRSINQLASRRVAVLIDGRDPSAPLLDAQEWAGVAFPVDNLAAAELVRGPSSALYGANAFNGVLILTTKAPQDQLGGGLRLATGDLDTIRGDLRFAAALGGGWYFKGVGSGHRSEDFYRSRNETVEYSRACDAGPIDNCLPLEQVPLPLRRDSVFYAGARFDRDFGQGTSLVLEGGRGDSEGPLFGSAAGRFQILDVARPWARFNFHTPRWNLSASYSERDFDAISLAAGTLSFSDGSRWQAELQGHWTFAGGRGRIVAGASAGREEVTTADPQGFQTLLDGPRADDKRALFTQLDYEFSDRLDLVVAGRWDDADLHRAVFSPQAALVLAVPPVHTVRLSYREAFLPAPFPELFARVPLAPPLEHLTGLEEAFCTPHGVVCGFDRPVPLLAVGNQDLDVEKIETWELGYSATLGRRTLLSLEYYRSEISGFIQTGIPQLGTELGRANERFGSYAPPSGLPGPQAAELLAELETALGDLFQLLSNPIADEPLIALITLANFGRLDNQGFELGLDYSLNRHMGLEFNYSWLDHDVREDLPGSPPLVANSPKSKLNLHWTYDGERLSAALHYRWSDSFRWVEALVNGMVPSYRVVNLDARYQLSRSWELGLNVSNLLDDEHYEFFSGDLLGRYALLHVGFSW